jgi:hypothetical protein
VFADKSRIKFTTKRNFICYKLPLCYNCTDAAKSKCSPLHTLKNLAWEVNKEIAAMALVQEVNREKAATARKRHMLRRYKLLKQQNEFE